MEPKRPIPSEDVRVWLSDRPLMTAAMMLEQQDAPPDVRVFAAAFEAWRSAHKAWRSVQRIDFDDLSHRWRMLGGPWIQLRAQSFEAVHADISRMCMPVRDAQTAAACMSDAEFAAWAATFYELLELWNRAAARFIDHASTGSTGS